MPDDTATDPIHGCVENWHANMRGRLPGGLDVLLHEDCVFLSPIVFTPQRGRDLTKLYLSAAGNTLVGEDSALAGSTTGDESAASSGDAHKGFRYVKEVREGHHALLEFETVIDGTQVNGADIITCDDDGMITEFKVMLRPLQAVNVVHAQMKAMLETLGNQ